MKRFQVIRTDISPYQAPDFTHTEKLQLESISGVTYCSLAEFDSDLETILITNTHTRLSKLPEGVLKSAKLIIHPNSGYDHFRQDHKLWETIPVVVGHTIRAQAVAEYSLLCLFEGLGQLPQHLTWSKSRTWERSLLKDQSVWIFGYGHIGKIIADTLATLGMKVTVVDPFINDCPHRLLTHWEDGQLSEARIVIAACSLNSHSKNIFNKNFFQQAHNELLFINGARGGLVVEEELKAFLQSHPKAFAFLDVFQEEPFQDNWQSFPQVWKTSHIAGVYKELDQKIIDFEVEVLRDFVSINSNFFMMKYFKELLENKWIQGELI